MILELIIVLIVVINFFLLYFKQLINYIYFIAMQGILVGLLPFLFMANEVDAKTVIISCITILLKGLIFPMLYFYALNKVKIKRFIEPYVGYKFSIITGLIGLIMSFWIAHHLDTPHETISDLVIPASFFTVFIGLFLIITRVKAITQSLAYLVIENGIYMFSFAFLIDQPLLVELGILLDVFAAVLIMSITIFHISRTFEHVNTLQMTTLKD